MRPQQRRPLDPHDGLATRPDELGRASHRAGIALSVTDRLLLCCDEPRNNNRPRLRIFQGGQGGQGGKMLDIAALRVILRRPLLG